MRVDEVQRGSRVRQTVPHGNIVPVTGHGLWKKIAILKEFLILRQAGPCGRPQFFR